MLGDALNICRHKLMLVHRLRRWTNAKPTLIKRVVSAGIYVYAVGLYHLVYVAGYANILIKIKQNETNNNENYCYFSSKNVLYTYML